jgi:hypothetical protein
MFTKSATRKDKRGFELISDTLAFGPVMAGLDAVNHAIRYAEF